MSCRPCATECFLKAPSQQLVFLDANSPDTHASRLPNPQKVLPNHSVLKLKPPRHTSCCPPPCQYRVQPSLRVVLWRIAPRCARMGVHDSRSGWSSPRHRTTPLRQTSYSSSHSQAAPRKIHTWCRNTSCRPRQIRPNCGPETVKVYCQACSTGCRGRVWETLPPPEPNRPGRSPRSPLKCAPPLPKPSSAFRCPSAAVAAAAAAAASKRFRWKMCPRWKPSAAGKR